MHKQYNALFSIMFLSIILFVVGCGSKKVEHVEAIVDRALMPLLDEDSVTTLISDSGVTKYRIVAPKWLVYDRAKPSYWEFPEGIYLENFDEQLVVKASIQSDYAHYDEDAEIWYLHGHVHSKNLEGEEFFTPAVWWNQKTGLVYSDSAIKIVRANSVIEGYGFQSNQNLTQYTILNPTGMFPIDNDE